MQKKTQTGPRRTLEVTLIIVHHHPNSPSAIGPNFVHSVVGQQHIQRILFCEAGVDKIWQLRVRPVLKKGVEEQKGTALGLLREKFVQQ